MTTPSWGFGRGGRGASRDVGGALIKDRDGRIRVKDSEGKAGTRQMHSESRRKTKAVAPMSRASGSKRERRKEGGGMADGTGKEKEMGRRLVAGPKRKEKAQEEKEIWHKGKFEKEKDF